MGQQAQRNSRSHPERLKGLFEWSGSLKLDRRSIQLEAGSKLSGSGAFSEAPMFARMTTFHVRPERLEDFRQWRRENEAEILAQPGLRHWIGMIGEDGQAFVVAVYDDVQAACDALPAARALWGRFADMVEGEPTARFLEVLATRGLAGQTS